MKFKFTKILPGVLLIVGLGAGILAGRFYYGKFCLSDRFKFVNKQLSCGGEPVINKSSYEALRNKIIDLIQSKIEANEVSEVAVYFRDLNNGPTMGINEYSKFIPASLLKLPLLMTYLNLSENQPGLLSKKLKFHTLKDIPLEQVNSVADPIKENTSYTVDELLKHMITHSDNNAYFVLDRYLSQLYPNQNPVLQTMRDLGIVDPQNFSDETITVKGYASIFVQLYNSSFFDKIETSEKALALLSDSDFHDGIEAGLPAGVKIAHKFGERSFENNNVSQLHDCGIVYYPNNPYLACIMTRGNDSTKLPHLISAISKMIYEEVDSRIIK